VLINFGTARVFAAGMIRRMTTMVTPGHAPLEQYGQQLRFGPHTDVYALGATLYHLLTGQGPTSATDRVIGVDLKSPRRLNAAVSEHIDRAVMWALEIRVDSRPRTVRAFLDALRQPAPPSPQERKKPD
jgi:F-box protein 11